MFNKNVFDVDLEQQQFGAYVTMDKIDKSGFIPVG